MTRRQPTPMAVRLPVGFQVEPRSAARRPMARAQSDQGSPFESHSLSSCVFTLLAGVVLLACAVAFAVLVL